MKRTDRIVQYRLLFAAIGLALFGLAPGSAQDELEPDFDSVLEDKDEVFKEELDAAEKGDQRKFKVVTDDNISALEEGDIYKNNNSFFKVTRIDTKGSNGGVLKVERIAGKYDPLRKWNRVSGLGPLTVASRETLLSWFFSGGILMYPIAFLLLVLIIITVNSLWVYRRGKQLPKNFVEASKQAILEGDLDKLEGLTSDPKGLFPSICRAMITNFSSSSMDDIRTRCETTAMRQISLLRTPLKGLNFIAAVAPLLGLLGTVIGMIYCFDSLAGETASAAKSQAMAAGIKVALLTTAAGLSVAVPSLFVFFIFTQKLNLIIVDCEGLAAEFVHALGTIKRRSIVAANVEDFEEDES